MRLLSYRGHRFPPVLIQHAGIVTLTEAAAQTLPQTYASLSAIARAITGTRWNGRAFFGLVSRQPAKSQQSPGLEGCDAAA